MELTTIKHCQTHQADVCTAQYSIHGERSVPVHTTTPKALIYRNHSQVEISSHALPQRCEIWISLPP